MIYRKKQDDKAAMSTLVVEEPVKTKRKRRAKPKAKLH